MGRGQVDAVVGRLNFKQAIIGSQFELEIVK
jgi:hypothetical protein